MGMFDDPKPFADHFQEGQPFRLEAAKVGNPINTIHGMNTPVLLKVGNEWYSMFGDGIRNQVERMDAGDLPRLVKIDRQPTKGGNTVKILVPVDQDQPQAQAQGTDPITEF